MTSVVLLGLEFCNCTVKAFFIIYMGGDGDWQGLNVDKRTDHIIYITLCENVVMNQDAIIRFLFAATSNLV